MHLLPRGAPSVHENRRGLSPAVLISSTLRLQQSVRWKRTRWSQSSGYLRAHGPPVLALAALGEGIRIAKVQQRRSHTIHTCWTVASPLMFGCTSHCQLLSWKPSFDPLVMARLSRDSQVIDHDNWTRWELNRSITNSHVHQPRLNHKYLVGGFNR